MGMLVYGTADELHRALQEVEALHQRPDGNDGRVDGNFMAGITVWWASVFFLHVHFLSYSCVLLDRCERCARNSVVSYRYFRKLCVEVDEMDENDVPSMHEYYSRMCIGAEMRMQFHVMNRQ